MAEISELLEQAASGSAPPVVLIEGDEYLARTSARELASALVPEKDRALNLLVLDAAAGAREIASHLVTVAMFPAPKAVVVEGAEVFAEEVDAERELARAQGSFSRALAAQGEWRELLERVEAALDAADEREVLDLAEACGERDAALQVAEAVHAWTRDVLVAQAGGVPDLAEMQGKAREIAGRVPPHALLGQAELCTDVLEALRQYGNGRLQIERLLIGSRELRRG